MDETKRIILQMFARYPSLATANEAQIAAMTAAYVETLRSFSSRAVSAACDEFRGKGSAFPPSADELFAECEKVRKAEEARQDWDALGRPKVDFSRYRLSGPQPRRFTPEELADWELVINGSGAYAMREDAKGAPLRIPAGYPGAGQPVAYGYLTPNEAKAVYDARARAARQRATRNYREAAE